MCNVHLSMLAYQIILNEHMYSQRSTARVVLHVDLHVCEWFSCDCVDVSVVDRVRRVYPVLATYHNVNMTCSLAEAV